MALRGKNIEFAKKVALKKPTVQYLLDHFTVMSTDEIMSSQVPGWVKEVVIIEKEMVRIRGTSKTPKEVADDVALKMSRATSVVPVNREYMHRIYQGDSCSVGKKLKIDVDAGDNLLFMDGNCVKINSVSVLCTDTDIIVLHSRSVYTGTNVSINDYNILLREGK